ncbi:hypothetical protein B296_00043369, partial [Ensete ventricosum]
SPRHRLVVGRAGVLHWHPVLGRQGSARTGLRYPNAQQGQFLFAGFCSFDQLAVL